MRQLYNVSAAAGYEATPAQWLLGRRPEQARQQLATSPDLGIAAIAHRCAFPDASHFSRRFREALGATPREWRADNAGP